MNEEIKPKREFVATVYIVRDGKVLLNKNLKLNKFIPVGGHVEENELPHEAVIREAKEETGFDIELVNFNNFPLLNTSSGEKPGRIIMPQVFGVGLDWIKPDHHHINLTYIAKITSGIQLEKSDDNTELKWFSKDELETHPDILNNVRKEALKAIEILGET